LNDSRRDKAASATAATPGATEQSFPLIALLQLATFLAAIAACVDGKELVQQLNRASELPLEAALLVLLAAAAVGSIGCFIGLGQVRAARSAAAGAAFGALVGLSILAVYAAPAPFARTAAAIAMMLVSTVAIRIRAA
jgi:hypothetical protein